MRKTGRLERHDAHAEREAFDDALAWWLGGKSMLTYGDATETVERRFVSGDYFSTLGPAARQSQHHCRRRRRRR